MIPVEEARVGTAPEAAGAILHLTTADSIPLAVELPVAILREVVEQLQDVLERVQGGRAARSTTDNTYASMALSRGASALGVALALGEVDRGALDDRAIGRDLGLWSPRASASAGVELLHSEIIVLGNSAAWSGDNAIAHGVMRDAIDLPSAIGVLNALDITISGQLDEAAASRILAVLAKTEASCSGTIRGARHVMWGDSDIQASRHARALVGGVLAGSIGRTDLFVSGGAEHQGPDGGGPIAVIARRPR